MRVEVAKLFPSAPHLFLEWTTLVRQRLTLLRFFSPIWTLFSFFYFWERPWNDWFGLECKCKVVSLISESICLILVFYCKFCTFRIIPSTHYIFLDLFMWEWISHIYIYTSLTFLVSKMKLFTMQLFLW